MTSVDTSRARARLPFRQALHRGPVHTSDFVGGRRYHGIRSAWPGSSVEAQGLRSNLRQTLEPIRIKSESGSASASIDVITALRTLTAFMVSSTVVSLSLKPRRTQRSMQSTPSRLSWPAICSL